MVSPFDTRSAVTRWRRRLTHLDPEVRDELESHLWDLIEARRAEGMTDREAFEAATWQLGHADLLEAACRSTFLDPSVSAYRIRMPAMVHHYVKIAARLLRRHFAYTFINVFGLALGLACCLLILLFVRDEWSYDRFHHNADRLYRLDKVVTPTTGGTERHAITSGLMGPTMAAEYPEVEQTVRVLPWFSDVLLTRDDETFKVPDVDVADANFFDVFDFDLLRGDPSTVLQAPMSIVLTEHVAAQLFPDRDPVGERIVGLNDLEYTVTGIAADPPTNSHLPFNALISWSSTVPGNGGLDFDWLNRWITQVTFTYVLMAPYADVEGLQAKLPDFMERHLPERADQYHLYLQPFADIYLGSSDLLYTGNTRQGNRTYVYVFSVLAVIIVLIACINFMNLSTARAAQRAREVGVRKVLGARRNQLGLQFLSESMVLSVVALVVALLILAAAMPLFASLTGKDVSPATLADPALLTAFVGLTLAVGLVAGSYPAFVLSAFNPVQIVRGTWRRHGKGATPRKVLVTTQFAASIVLLIGTAVVFRQMDYVSRKNLGFAGDQLVVLPIGDTGIADQYDAFKQEVLGIAGVVDAAGSNAVPGDPMMSFGILPEGKTEKDAWTASAIRIDDFDFAGTYGVEMVAGRYFDGDHPTDPTNGVVINEALARSLGWTPQEAVGKALSVSGELSGGHVIGVVKDFNVASLHRAIEPLLFYYMPRHGTLTVRITGENTPATIEGLRDVWERFEKRSPFSYTFLDQRFARFYQSDRRMMRVLGVFTALALIVACLGLFGLAAYTSALRTREIGIRKTFGATVTRIVLLLSSEFTALVAAGFVVAVPVAYYATARWLDDFAYRIDVSWQVFAFAGLAALGIALLTVSYQAVKAARTNPVEALREA